MKKLFTGMLVLISIQSFAEVREDFAQSQKNVKISNEIKSRISDGIYAGLDSLDQDCTVEVEGTSITIKTSKFEKKEDNYDCLQSDNIACFEFSTDRYLPLSTRFSNAEIFSAKVKKQDKNVFQLSAKRNLGGDASYKLTLSSNNENKMLVKIAEQVDSMKRNLDCTIDL